MRLGFAVKVLGEGGLPTHDARRWQSGPHLRWSVEAMHGVLDYLERHDIAMYRMTASLAPYATHPDLSRFHRQVA
jgi:UV DNA damage endonuclease